MFCPVQRFEERQKRAPYMNQTKNNGHSIPLAIAIFETPLKFSKSS